MANGNDPEPKQGNGNDPEPKGGEPKGTPSDEQKMKRLEQQKRSKPSSQKPSSRLPTSPTTSTKRLPRMT